MKKQLMWLVLLALAGPSVHAQSSQNGLRYGQPAGDGRGLRGAYAGDQGIGLIPDEASKISRPSYLPDWVPQGGDIRLVGNYLSRALQAQSATPYVGVGYGQLTNIKGLGFYAGAGVMLGAFGADTGTQLSGNAGAGGPATLADVDAQKQSLNDSLLGLKLSPRISIGLEYRY
jgi:hypothetical protein